METFFSNLTPEEGTREKFARDLSALVRDAEELVKAASGQAAEKSRVELAGALERLKASCRTVQARTASSVRQADQLIREHPYPSLGIAFGVGLLIGVLLDRRGRE